jgi:hypothetical protein
MNRVAHLMKLGGENARYQRFERIPERVTAIFVAKEGRSGPPGYERGGRITVGVVRKPSISSRPASAPTYLIQLEQGVFVATPDGMTSDYLLVPAPVAAQFKNLSKPWREPYVSEEEAMVIRDQDGPTWTRP